MWDAEEPVVIEATNRLPEPLFEARAYRIMRVSVIQKSNLLGTRL